MPMPENKKRLRITSEKNGRFGGACCVGTLTMLGPRCGGHCGEGGALEGSLEDGRKFWKKKKKQPLG